MRRIYVFPTLVSLALILGCTPKQSGADPTLQVLKTYQASSQDFPNPERGFFAERVGWDRSIRPGMEDLSLATMRQARRDGNTLLRVSYVIPDFKGKDLSRVFLAKFNQQLEDARRAGVKLIPLFAYSLPSDGFDRQLERPENQDAPLSDVLRHVEQLKPVIRRNSDVIAIWDAGFIGEWGEWHTSTNRLIGDEVGAEVNDKTRLITTKLLETIPENRMITLRTPRYKQQISGVSALTSEQAFSGTAQARLGAKDDCFLASRINWGTYLPADEASIQGYKDFLHQENLFLPQIGETCNAGADAQPYIRCPNALQDLAYLRFSSLNIDYERNVLQNWRDGGCFEEISRRLGYRFVLVNSSLPAEIDKAANLVMSVDVENVGFASPFNPRSVELVLRDKATEQIFRIVIASGGLQPVDHVTDPRFWTPGTTSTVSINVALPSALPAGTYEVLLNLPDPMPRLENRPAYSIRFANLGTWEAKTGFNSLLRTLTVR